MIVEYCNLPFLNLTGQCLKIFLEVYGPADVARERGS